MSIWLDQDLRVQISPSGMSVSCRYCGLCGVIVPLALKHLHEAFHARLVEDPRYPYTVRKASGEAVYPPGDTP